MRRLGFAILLWTAAGAGAFAQQWEVGGSAGARFLSNVAVTAPTGSATAGFQPGVAAGVFFGQNLYKHLSGEFHYEFLQSNLRLSGDGSEATFSGVAHAVHYDLVLRKQRGESPMELFAAFGGGMKIFSGTGKEAAYQPLSQYGYFTRTRQVEPMASVGAGFKYRIGDRLFLRVEIHDFITPFPKNIIAPPDGVKYGSILNDLVPMVGISYEF